MNWITNNKPLVVSVVLAFLIGVGGAAAYFYIQSGALKPDSATISKQEIAAILEKVNKLIVLPEGETPTVATVSDPTKLQSQAFFADAKVGDKVLIYTIAKKAFLYDPAENRLINVAPLNIGVGTTSAALKP